MIMADLEKLSWREKLDILRSMPKPHTHTHTQHRSHSLNKVLVQKSSKTHQKPLSEEYMKQKLMEYHEKLGKQTVYNYATPVPDCLNTFSDFFNPQVSADERFDKYLLETERSERSDKRMTQSSRLPLPANKGAMWSSISDMESQRKVVLGDLLQCANDKITDFKHEPESESEDTTVLDKRYRPGSKGGGWKVLPQISGIGTGPDDSADGLHCGQDEDLFRLPFSVRQTCKRTDRSSHGSESSRSLNSSKQTIVMPPVT